jgi:hypothetical protein
MWICGTFETLRAEVDYRHQQVREDLGPVEHGEESSSVRRQVLGRQDASDGPGPDEALRVSAVPPPRTAREERGAVAR